MRIAVIGSSGAMGAFFVSYFRAKGHRVVGSDVVPPKARTGVKLASSNSAAAKGADAVLIATPIDGTVETAIEVLPQLKRGAVLIEISSVKTKTFPALKRASEGKGFTLLSVHPLFGPSLHSTMGMKIAVIEDGTHRSARIAKRLFPDASLFPVDLKTHERLMAVLLTLTHITGMAYGAAVAGNVRLEEFRKLATPSASLQMTLTQSVLSQDPSLYSYMAFENRFVRKAVESLVSELESIRRMLDDGDRRGFEREFARLGRACSPGQAATRRVYQKTGR